MARAISKQILTLRQRPSRYGRLGKRRIDLQVGGTGGGSPCTEPSAAGMLGRSTHRRLSNWVLIAFHLACDQRDLEVADQPIAILEHRIAVTATGRRAIPRAAKGRRATFDRNARAAMVVAPFQSPRRLASSIISAHETFPLWRGRPGSVGSRCPKPCSSASSASWGKDDLKPLSSRLFCWWLERWRS